jgi:hypothetical protein
MVYEFSLVFLRLWLVRRLIKAKVNTHVTGGQNHHD